MLRCQVQTESRRKTSIAYRIRAVGGTRRGSAVERWRCDHVTFDCSLLRNIRRENRMHTRYYSLLIEVFGLLPGTHFELQVLTALSCSVFFLFYRLRFSFRFSVILDGGLWYSIFLSWRYTPLALLANLKYAYSPLRAVFFLAFLMTNFIFLPFLPFYRFFRLRFGHRLFHPVFFLWVICCHLGQLFKGF